MSESPVLVSREGDLALVTVNRPTKLNALDGEVLQLLLTAIEDLTRDARGPGGVRAVVLTGAGDKAFVAGADIAAMRTMGTAQAKSLSDLGHRLGDRMESAPFVVIAAVNGFALGGGCELAMACDLIYASEKAKFGQPEVNLGVIPGFGGTQRLVRRVGVGKARELLFTGDLIDATEAHRIGLIEAIVPHGTVVEHAKGVAKKIAGKGPLAIQQAKAVLRRGDAGLASANELEAQAFAMLFGTDDQKEGMAAFLEKRAAAFKAS